MTARLGDAGGEVAWEQVPAILAINRLAAPGSEWRIHREWFLHTALADAQRQRTVAWFTFSALSHSSVLE